jgi:hypothetical protein
MAVSDHTPNDDAEERRAIARIEQALSELGADYSPPVGWEARVLAASARAPKKWWQRWQRWMVTAVPAALAAAAVMVVVIARRPVMSRDKNVQVAFSDTVIEDPCKNAAGNPACMNSQENACSAHQVRRLEASSSAAHLAMRLYKGSMLIQSCDDPKACETMRGTLGMRWTVTELGSYTALSFASNQPLPALTGALDPDLATLDRANITPRKKRFDCR